MTDEESEQNDANSDEGVVFANTKLPALGWFVNYAIYDGTINLHNFVESLFMSNGAKVKDMARKHRQ